MQVGFSSLHFCLNKRRTAPELLNPMEIGTLFYSVRTHYQFLPLQKNRKNAAAAHTIPTKK